MLARDGVTIELLGYLSPDCIGDGSRRPMNQLGLTHLHCRVDDVDAVAAAIEELGGTVVRATRTTFDPAGNPLDFLYCTDPDGVRIELMRPARVRATVSGPSAGTRPRGSGGPGVRYGGAVTSDPVRRPRHRPRGGHGCWSMTAASSSTCARTTSGRPGMPPRPCTWPWAWSPDRVDEIPTDRTVVCVCRVGGRSGAVATALAGAGYDVRNLAGGMLAWEAAGLPVVTDDGGTGRII